MWGLDGESFLFSWIDDSKEDIEDNTQHSNDTEGIEEMTIIILLPV